MSGIPAEPMHHLLWWPHGAPPGSAPNMELDMTQSRLREFYAANKPRINAMQITDALFVPMSSKRALAVLRGSSPM